MRKEYEMTEEEVQAIYAISKNQMPVIFVGTWLGLESKQEKANNLWRQMGKKYGFLWNTVGPSRTSKDPKCFSAVEIEADTETK